MPELPEVENVARALRACLLGRTLTGMRVRFGGVLRPSPAAVRRAVSGRTLAAVHRHGKYIILTFAGPAKPEAVGARARGTAMARDGDARHLMIHLRMTGQLFANQDFEADAHTHLSFDFDGVAVHYRDVRKFGRLALVDDGHGPAALAHVGPDMLSIGFGAWRERLAGRRAPIKAVLLDQKVAAGLGNIYADEALFRARIHPLTPAGDLGEAQLRRLFLAARGVLRLAIRHGGTTYLDFVDFHGRPGNFRRKLRVYQRTGQPCRVCGSAIARVTAAGRSTHFCPRCQAAAPRRRPAGDATAPSIPARAASAAPQKTRAGRGTPSAPQAKPAPPAARPKRRGSA